MPLVIYRLSSSSEDDNTRRFTVSRMRLRQIPDRFIERLLSDVVIVLHEFVDIDSIARKLHEGSERQIVFDREEGLRRNDEFENALPI